MARSHSGRVDSAMAHLIAAASSHSRWELELTQAENIIRHISDPTWKSWLADVADDVRRAATANDQRERQAAIRRVENWQDELR